MKLNFCKLTRKEHLIMEVYTSLVNVRGKTPSCLQAKYPSPIYTSCVESTTEQSPFSRPWPVVFVMKIPFLHSTRLTKKVRFHSKIILTRREWFQLLCIHVYIILKLLYSENSVFFFQSKTEKS